MIKIVLGTRPEIIKLSPIINGLEEEGIYYQVLFTNQHFSKNMGQNFLDIFKINKKYIVYNRSKNILSFLSDNIKAKDKVVVQGDTRSVYYGALISNMKGAKLFHVEAGLRTGDFNSPYPEEFYRVETSKLAHHHFAPTVESKNNLLDEGIDEKNITVTGNTIMQSLGLIEDGEVYTEENKIIVTIHRKENVKYMDNIVQCLLDGSKRMTNIIFNIIIHPNNYLKDKLDMRLPENIKLLKPLNYLDFISELRSSKGVITDSGGLQEECCYFNLPCVVLRETTERPEAVDAGYCKLISPKEKINFIEILSFIQFNEASKSNPYYDKRCVKKIINEVIK